MSNKKHLKEVGFFKRFIQRFKDKRLAKKMPDLVKKDPALKNQLNKVFKAYAALDKSLDDTEKFARYLDKKYGD